MKTRINRREFIGAGAAFAAAGCQTRNGGFPALGTIPMHGRIALQGIHGGKAVRFKYLKVKEL